MQQKNSKNLLFTNTWKRIRINYTYFPMPNPLHILIFLAFLPADLLTSPSYTYTSYSPRRASTKVQRALHCSGLMAFARPHPLVCAESRGRHAHIMTLPSPQGIPKCMHFYMLYYISIQKKWLQAAGGVARALFFSDAARIRTDE